MPDAHETARQHVQQEATQELIALRDQDARLGVSPEDRSPDRTRRIDGWTPVQAFGLAKAP